MTRRRRLEGLALGVRLVGAGLAGPWTLGVLVLAGEVAADVSGPCAVTSLLIATLGAFLAAICHAEISQRRHASLYEGARDVLGVRCALILGWASVAWRLAAIAACARGLGATVDYIMGGRIRRAATSWVENVVPFMHGVVPDPLAGGATVFTGLLFSLGLERSRSMRLLLNVCVTLAILFFVTAGASHCETDAWQAHAFLPAGVTGLLSGAALSSAGLLGTIAVRAESARLWARSAGRGPMTGPSRRLELVTSLSALLIAAVASLVVTAVLTMMVNFRSLGTDAPALVQAFEVRDVDWARLVMATLGITALSLALVELTPPLHRLVRALAADRLLCLSLARDFAPTGTPVAAIAVCSIVVSLLAFLSPVAPLLQVAACGALLINAASAASATLLRFQPNNELTTLQATVAKKEGQPNRLTVHSLRNTLGAIPGAVKRAGEACRWGGELSETHERAPLVLNGDSSAETRQQDNSSSELSGYESDSSSSTDIDAVVAEFKEKIKVVTLGEYAPKSMTPDAITSRRATLVLTAAIVTSCIACAATLSMLNSNVTSPGHLLLLTSSSVATLALLCITTRQPQTPKKCDEFRVPLAPWLPAATTLLHMLLLMQLLLDAWLPTLLFATPGAVAFAVREWRLARRRGVALRRRGERIHLNCPPTHPVISTLVPSHQHLPPHSQRRLTRVDTILISR